VQFHVLSFEGPDAYARIGGLASRVEGLTECLVALGFETHHWFVGDPSLPGHQTRQQLHLHRWCQWISRYRPGGVYDGEEEKLEDFSRSAPPEELHGIDVVSLLTHLSPSPRRVLLRSADAVLANSVHEPFGLVGLETMAVGGIACTGCSGEDYVLPGQNALMVETDDPAEFLELYRWLRSHPKEERSLRRTARWTARRFAWPEVLDRLFLPHLMANGSCGTRQPTSAPFPGALARAG